LRRAAGGQMFKRGRKHRCDGKHTYFNHLLSSNWAWNVKIESTAPMPSLMMFGPFSSGI
jgi:hypothetical protein